MKVTSGLTRLVTRSPPVPPRQIVDHGTEELREIVSAYAVHPAVFYLQINRI